MEPIVPATEEDEVDGGDIVKEFRNRDQLWNALLKKEDHHRRVLGFPDPPPPAKSWAERIARFFGVDEEQAELEIWKIRHALALQGYLKNEYVRVLRDYEVREGGRVIFKLEEGSVLDNKKISFDPAHPTGRSFEIREIARPLPPSKSDVWWMFLQYCIESIQRLNTWRKGRALQVMSFGHDFADHFQDLAAQIKLKVQPVEDVDDATDGESLEELTFFDDRSLPFLGGSSVDGSVRSSRPLSEITDERSAARCEADGSRCRRGNRKIEQDLPDQASDRSHPTYGLMSLIFGGRTRRGTIDTATQKKLNDVYCYRPYFMYWASMVHILVMIITLATYGFAPIGVGSKVETGAVLDVNGASRIVQKNTERNFWFGPTFANLIHLGAKYGPCMRKDTRIFAAIEKERAAERDTTACCVRSDSQTCFQSTRGSCAMNFFRWLKWNGTATVNYVGGSIPVPTYSSPDLVSQADPRTCVGSLSQCYRTSGSVCGQDPVTCVQPASTFPREWPDDISQWPVCTQVDSVLNDSSPTSSCELTGRPCCTGKQGVCTIATEEHCNYVGGTYHGDKRLCSEVNCLENTCGLTPFLYRDTPDQVYRLWTSLCLHAGIIPLLFTLLVHMTIGRQIEKLVGWFRMGMIYIVSGIGGNIVSLVFVPYQAEVGPGPALFGLLATMVVDVLKQRHILRRPKRELTKILILALIAVLLGFLPFFDNFAHVGGFVMGYFMSLIFIPPDIGQPLSFTRTEQREYTADEKRWFRRYNLGVMLAGFLAIVAYFLVFFLLFYDIQLYCKNCLYFNCIPLTENLCKDLSVDLTQRRCHVCTTA